MKFGTTASALFFFLYFVKGRVHMIIFRIIKSIFKMLLFILICLIGVLMILPILPIVIVSLTFWIVSVTLTIVLLLIRIPQDKIQSMIRAFNKVLQFFTDVIVNSTKPVLRIFTDMLQWAFPDSKSE